MMGRNFTFCESWRRELSGLQGLSKGTSRLLVCNKKDLFGMIVQSKQKQAQNQRGQA
jgi:hypothetical protein